MNVWIVQTYEGEICFVCSTKQVALNHFRDRNWRFECDDNGNVRIYDRYAAHRYNCIAWTVEAP